MIFLSLSLVNRSVAQSAAPAEICETYLQKISDAAIAIGRASGRFQISEAILPKKGGDAFAVRGTERWIRTNRDAAEHEVQTATTAARALGEPPPRCGFERKTVTVPAIALGSVEGASLGYLSYADVVGKLAPKAKQLDGTPASLGFLQLAAEYYPQTLIDAKRAALEAVPCARVSPIKKFNTGLAAVSTVSASMSKGFASKLKA